MASHITEIMDAIANMTITGYTMPVYYGATERDWAEIAHLPMRNISCYTQGNHTSTMTTGSYKVFQTQWIIEDTAYIQKVSMGLGKRQIAPTMYGYAGAYIEALRNLSTSNYWSLENYAVTPSALEWPQASTDYMHVVRARLTITDIVQ